MNDNSNIYDFWGAPKKSTPTTSFNTPPQMGTSGCTCGGMGSPSCPVHGGSTSLQTPTPEFKTTGEAVGYFYDKQHPNGGMTKMTGPLGDISYYDENLYKTKEPTTGFDNRLKQGEQLASAAYNGLSGGFNDEIEGGLNGFGYGVANLGMRGARKLGFNVRDLEEDAWEAMQRGYKEARDYRRQTLQDGRKAMPLAMNAVEMAGAVVTPLNKILPNIPGAPLAKRATRNMYNAGLSGGIYGIGTTEENTPQEYAENIGVGMAGNILGNKLTNRFIGKVGDDFTRNVYENNASGAIKEAYNQVTSPLSTNSATEEDEEEWKRRLRRMLGLL